MVIDGLSLFDARSLRPVQPPLFKDPVAFVLLDHDKTMTKAVDRQNRLSSLSLHKGATEVLEEGLLASKGFAVSSTVNVFRLMRQYSRNIRSTEARCRLILSGEAGAVFAIPNDPICRDYTVMLKPSNRSSFSKVRRRLSRLVAQYERERGVDVFLNQDLLANFTIENFSGDSQASRDLADLTRGILKETGADADFFVSKGTYSVEVMRRHPQKDSAVRLFRKLLPKGTIISIGDGFSDVPAFRESYGIQIPAEITRISQIDPLPRARLIAVGSEASGGTTERVLRMLLNSQRMLKIDYHELQASLRLLLKSEGFTSVRKVRSSSIRSDYTLPKNLRRKYAPLLNQLGKH